MMTLKRKRRNEGMMSLNRHNPKRDKNEPEIVAALERVGANVYRLNLIDLLVLFRGDIYLLEVKTDKGKVTEAQRDFLLDNADCKQVGIVRSTEEALEFVGAT